MNRLYVTIFKTVVLGLLVVGIYVGLSYKFTGLSFWKRKPVELKDTKVIIEDSKKIAQLFSAKYYAEIIVDSAKYVVKDKIDLTKSIMSLSKTRYKDSIQTKIVLLAFGNCYAGNDLEKVEIKSDEKGLRCHLVIPSAKIYHTIINPSDFDLFHDEGNWSKEEVAELKKKAVQKVKDFALNNGIIKKANERTSKLLTDFLTLSGYKEVKIDFSE